MPRKKKDVDEAEAKPEKKDAEKEKPAEPKPDAEPAVMTARPVEKKKMPEKEADKLKDVMAKRYPGSKFSIS